MIIIVIGTKIAQMKNSAAYPMGSMILKLTGGVRLIVIYFQMLDYII